MVTTDWSYSVSVQGGRINMKVLVEDNDELNKYDKLLNYTEVLDVISDKVVNRTSKNTYVSFMMMVHAINGVDAMHAKYVFSGHILRVYTNVGTFIYKGVYVHD